uniref:Uncharacterized protein n=1 Tax=Strix occidentalis caurina TaxID=311401 RepID=A0A8D0FSQ3_STROC
TASDMKKDIDTLIAQEKEEIIAKYEKGRQEGAQIDPWEDADFTLYKVTDRFLFSGGIFWGYFLKCVLSSSPLHQQKQQEIERVDKWLKMLKKWGKYRNSDKVRRKRKSMCPEGQECHCNPELFLINNICNVFLLQTS